MTIAMHHAKHNEADRAGLVMTVNAVVVLAAVGLVIRLFGFKTLHSFVGRVPTRAKRASMPTDALLEDVCCALRRAVSYRLTPAMCLRRAAAAVCLLRPRGIDAALVIGIQRLPFAAHAWTEVNGRVVTEAKDWVNTYKEIARF